MKFVIRNWQMFKGRHTKLMLRREQLAGMSDRQINLYLSKIKWNYLNDSFKSRFVKTIGGMRYIGGLIMKESGRSTLTHQDGYSMWHQVFPLRKGSAAHKAAFNVTATPPTKRPAFKPMPGPSALKLDRATITDAQRPLIEKAFVKAANSAYGKSYSSAGEAAKAFSDVGFHWEQGSDPNRTVVLAEFKTRFKRALYRAFRSKRSLRKGLFSRGRVTDSVAKKIYNTLVYPKGAAAVATPAPPPPAQPAAPKPSTPPAPTGGPSGAGAAQGTKGTGGTMTQAIKNKTHDAWETVCGAEYAKGEVKKTLDAAGKTQLEKICAMDDAARDKYFSSTPMSSMPGWLQKAIKGQGVTVEQYQTAWKPSGGSSSPAAARPAAPAAPAAPTTPAKVPPAQAGNKRKIHGSATKRRSLVEAAYQLSFGTHESGSTEPYSTQPSNGYINKSRGVEYVGFMLRALFPIPNTKQLAVGAMVDYSMGQNKDQATESDGSSSYGKFARWAISLAGEYMIKQGGWGSISLGVHLGFGSTKITCGNFGQGGACLDKSTVDIVFGADLVYRRPVYTTEKFQVSIMAALGFKAVYGLDKNLGRDWPGEDIVSDDIPIYTKNRGFKGTGSVGVAFEF